MSLGPFDLPGAAFLTLYCVLLAAAIVAGFVIPRWLRPEGRAQNLSRPDQIAYLAGGKTRFADTVVARLLSIRALAMGSDNSFYVQSRDSGRNAAEASVLGLSAPIGWGSIQHALRPHIEPVERTLETSGLLMGRGLTLQMRFWQTAPYLLLIMFGAIKWQVGVARDKPVGFLTVLLVVTALFALIRWCAVDRLTRGGRDALARARAHNDRLRRAPTQLETDHAVALFGTVVLVGSGWAAFHTLRTQTSGSEGSSSSGDSSSGGDSGCGGGGGCGGCGGGGD